MARLSACALLAWALAAEADDNHKCWNDHQCRRYDDSSDCSSNLPSFQKSKVQVAVAERLTLSGADTCALWMWEETGKTLGVIWNGVPRGLVTNGACLELYAAPGYSMDTSNVTVTCVNFITSGCVVNVATNPPGTTCNADGSLGLADWAKVVIGAAALLVLCCVVGCICWCCKRRRPVQTVVVVGASGAQYQAGPV
eukprot:TRINITY_DN64983_c0_g1_i1.p2 TRINITY_DN64983_c0_g1~~TRINITY_DN64983_c0_g1_i1.p2  ORF type:complete len:219 (+),score=81.44 TRINITY_DN64983_c0_g1_i1:69-659(+)